ncbi:hypothetical protein FGIG_06633, partial [Fasciola gigantica]
ILLEKQFEIGYQIQSCDLLHRFILAGSVLYDKDVLGGKVDQYVDVTDFTAHRIRLEKVDWLDDHGGLVSARSANPDAAPVSRLILTGGLPQESPDEEVGPIKNAPMNYTQRQSIRAWILGQRAGRVRVRLAPIDRAHLKSRMPPGLVKQLKDQKSDLIDSADLDSFGDDSLWAGIVKDEPTLEVIVRDEPGSWPVGISVQVVTDFSMALSQMTDQENSGHSAQSIKSAGSRHPIMGSDVATAAFLTPFFVILNLFCSQNWLVLRFILVRLINMGYCFFLLSLNYYCLLIVWSIRARVRPHRSSENGPNNSWLMSGNQLD